MGAGASDKSDCKYILAQLMPIKFHRVAVGQKSLDEEEGKDVKNRFHFGRAGPAAVCYNAVGAKHCARSVHARYP